MNANDVVAEAEESFDELSENLQSNTIVMVNYGTLAAGDERARIASVVGGKPDTLTNNDLIGLSEWRIKAADYFSRRLRGRLASKSASKLNKLNAQESEKIVNDSLERRKLGQE